MADREFSYSTGEGAARVMHRAIDPDMAAAVDKPWEILAEDFGIPLVAAVRIFKWHELQMQAGDEKHARELAVVVASLIQPSDNLRAKVWGLALSYGLAVRLVGARNGTDLSTQLGCTRALISHYKRYWDRLLGSNVQIFGKTKEACERMRVSRIAFVRRQKEKQN